MPERPYVCYDSKNGVIQVNEMGYWWLVERFGPWVHSLRRRPAGKVRPCA